MISSLFCLLQVSQLNGDVSNNDWNSFRPGDVQMDFHYSTSHDAWQVAQLALYQDIKSVNVPGPQSPEPNNETCWTLWSVKFLLFNPLGKWAMPDAANKENYKGIFEGVLGFGHKAAVIVVDFTKAYTTPASHWFCGGKGFGVVDAVAESKPLIELARSKGVPIFYTKVCFEHPTDGGIFTQKIPLLRTWTKDNPLVEIDDNVAPQAGDSVLVKQYPSAFFGTNLACNLRAINVDTCIIIGCSTSGCIRASVLDGMQHGFRCIVPRECVGDRTQSIHESNLFDMNAKNGDVVDKAIVMQVLSGCESDIQQTLEQPAKRTRVDSPQTTLINRQNESHDMTSNAQNYKGIFEGGLGFGQKAAVIVVDFTKAYTTPASHWFCGGKGFGVVDAVAESKPLIELARSKGVPIFYTKVCFEHPTDGGIFTQKIPLLRTWTKDSPLAEIDDNVAPQAGDSVLVKQYPSAFFGTNLACNLRAINVDTCIIIGCSTSGCIRASVLDGMQHGFRCIVPRECVGDRTQSIHENNLFDMNAKNGDVVDKAIVMDHFSSL